jgi:hypothetical protein
VETYQIAGARPGPIQRAAPAAHPREYGGGDCIAILALGKPIATREHLFPLERNECTEEKPVHWEKLPGVQEEAKELYWPASFIYSSL